MKKYILSGILVLLASSAMFSDGIGAVSPGFGTVTPNASKKKKPERIFVRELIGSETAGFRLSYATSTYHCIKCGIQFIFVIGDSYYCIDCKRTFNIEEK